jgi:hypothetical protein
VRALSETTQLLGGTLSEMEQPRAVYRAHAPECGAPS